jgi:hypothetical protein
MAFYDYDKNKGALHALLAELCMGKTPKDSVFTRKKGGAVKDSCVAWQNL